MNTGGTDPAAAASLSDTVDAASLASLFPNIDTSKHVVMEVNEPNFLAKLAEGHEEREAWLKMRQPQIEAELEAKKKAKSYSADSIPAVGAASLDAPLALLPDRNVSTGPIQTPQDAQALAESMAASAGEGASKDPADYLATATSLIGSYSTPDTTLTAPAAAAAAEPEGAVAAMPVATFDGRRRLLQTNTVQDLLVVYTPAAASAAGGVAGIENTIRIAVQQTNLAYSNSRVALTLRLVGIRQVSSNKPGLGTAALCGWFQTKLTIMSGTCLVSMQYYCMLAHASSLQVDTIS
jgi:hypothetical protein